MAVVTMSDAKTKVQIRQEWDELYQYIKNDILGYKDKSLSKHFVLRLKGLADGKFMANKRVEPKAKYEFTEILTTFKMCKFDIMSAIRDKDRFKNEQHMVNYIMVIIENNINDVVDRINRIKQSKQQGEAVEVVTTDTKAEYVRKTKEVSSSLLEDLW